ncbi:hypothetical protein OROHE_024993 [Orobanche hederae]
MIDMLTVGGKPAAGRVLVTGHKVEEDEELLLSSDSEIFDLDFLDSKYDEEVDGAFSIPSRRPNAHGGIHSFPNASPLQPLPNRMQRGQLYIIDVSQSVDLNHPCALDFLREDSIHVSISSYIPKTLDDVKNAEEDVTRLTSGQDTGDMYSKTITGLNQASSLSSSEKPNYCHLESSEEEEEEVDCCASLLNEAKTAVDKKAIRKENKKKVKQEKRVARETKVPKAMRLKKKKYR